MQQVRSFNSGMACSAHRITLASLIIAEKYLCDVPLKNVTWLYHAGIFTLKEVNLMEREFMAFLVICINSGL
jgi:hypothetical protein